MADLADAIRPRYRVMVLTGAYTGLRPGELIALRIDRLDILRRQLRVEEPLKTPSSRRTVSFPPFLAEELAEHLATYPGNDGRLFTAPAGGPLNPATWRRRYWYPGVDASVGRPVGSSGSPSSDGHQTDNGWSPSMSETAKSPANTRDFEKWS